MADEKAKSENRELAKTIGFGNEGFAIQNMAQATLVAETLISSALVPTHFNSTAKIIVVAQASKELGKPLWWGLNNMYVVSGKVGISSAAIAGLILQSGVCVQWQVTEEGKFDEDDFAIIITSKRKNFEVASTTKFSVKDAKSASLWNKDIWKKYPKQMLTWRAIAFHARMYYADVLGGSYTAEELEDTFIQPPVCDTPPRDERRTVVSKSVEPAPVPDNLFARALVQEAQEKEDLPDANTEGSTEAAASSNISIEDVYANFSEAHGTKFKEWAAFVLCRDEDEVDSPEKFTAEMIAQLDRSLHLNGIDTERF